MGLWVHTKSEQVTVNVYIKLHTTLWKVQPARRYVPLPPSHRFTSWEAGVNWNAQVKLWLWNSAYHSLGTINHPEKGVIATLLQFSMSDNMLYYKMVFDWCRNAKNCSAAIDCACYLSTFHKNRRKHEKETTQFQSFMLLSQRMHHSCESKAFR